MPSVNLRFLCFSVVNFFYLATAFSQQSTFREFNKNDYPAGEYIINSDTFQFQKLKIALTHTKRTGTSSYCRIWLTVRDRYEMLDSLYYNDSEALGGCSGIYVDQQKRKDYFILSKFGDYDGRVIIVDDTGAINSYYGGEYFLSDDNKYLFSPYSSDLHGLTVYDLSKNRVLFTSKLKFDPSNFYFYDNKYFAVKNEITKQEGKTKIATYDFLSNKLIESTVDDSYISQAKRLQSYNVITRGPCICGDTTKP